MEIPTRDQFAEWLAAKGKKRVGVARDSGRCPLATLLLELNPEASRAYADGVDYSLFIGIESKKQRMQKWAAEFVERVDDLRNGEEKQITGAEALEVLEAV